MALKPLSVFKHRIIKMESTQQNEILALIARSLAGLASIEDSDKLNEWIGFSESNRKYFNHLRNIWDASDKQIDQGMINTPEALKKVLDRISIAAPKKRFWFYWQKIAAVIIIPIAIGTFLLGYFESVLKSDASNELAYNMVYSPFGTRSSLVLNDSTHVWLNSGSRLMYPVKFSKKSRKVFLEGEAYFEVKSNPSKPFIVQTTTVEVKATGTKFDVQCYSARSSTEITLGFR